MYADDVKLFDVVKPGLGHVALQGSLDRIDEWCLNNGMALNDAKCVMMSFRRGSNVLDFQYFLRGAPLKRVLKFKDLGVVMSPSLSPLEHICGMTSRAGSLLGFIFRSSRDFRSLYSLLVLFRALVLPVLEYASVVWSPYHQYQIDQLHRVQRRFVRMLGCRMGFAYFDVSVMELENRFGLLPLAQRRRLNDLVLLFKLVNGTLDCPELLAGIDICAPRGTRSRTIFRRCLHTTAYTYNSGLSRILRSGCEAAAAGIEFFGVSAMAFKGAVLQLGL
ncbi:uncharacterized protein LOC120349659 [Nilaparvata lugens]|uniref:uncharacterized protein LOC120349659 n=1 Tax=Nilaparvata lugens TaxID=108931 RepID=UPI00193D2B64|nr:uncharacterized protein LOC120349659 [Nilaparvata lugens]